MAALKFCVFVLIVGILFSLQMNAHGQVQMRNRAISSSRQQGGAGKDHWTYNGRRGSQNWWRSHPSCRGPRQSPININTCSVTVIRPRSLPSIVLRGYGTVANVNLKNTGSSVKLQFTEGNSRARGGLLKGIYRLDSIHFHWGSNNGVGSEHAIDHKRYPLEMHLVHYNTDRYKSMKEAQGKPGGLGVLAFFFKIGKFNWALQGIVGRLNRVKFPDQVVRIPSMSLARLLQARVDRFYTYRGSLTTPPCSRHVTWSVFPYPIELSQKQMDEFRSAVLSKERISSSNNFRPHQPMFGRRVLANHPSLRSNCRSRPLLGLKQTIATSKITLLGQGTHGRSRKPLRGRSQTLGGSKTSRMRTGTVGSSRNSRLGLRTLGTSRKSRQGQGTLGNSNIHVSSTLVVRTG